MIETTPPQKKDLLITVLSGVLAGLVLIILGKILVPTTNWVSLLGATLILIVYGLIIYFGLQKIPSSILRFMVYFGLAASLVYTGEILLEYLLLPQDNTTWGLIEFGAVFCLFFLCGLWASYWTRRVRAGVLSALGTAMLSSLIWFIVVFSVFYIFRGTDRQQQVFLAEGNYQDFAASGMADFSAFVMEDFLGAGFFHLALMPVISLLLGLIGGLIGRGVSKVNKQPDGSPGSGSSI